MSQYLSFELINKENPEIKVDLGYWCTSIARSISYNFNNIFNYTDNEQGVELNVDELKSYIEILHNGIEDYKKNLHEEQEKRKENIELLLKAQTVLVINAIKEEICANEVSIKDWEEDIDTWTSVERKLEFILEILNENNNKWTLKYSNS